MTERMLSGRELAERWNLSTKTLDAWRCNRFGPAYVKMGKAVRYRLEDVIEFERQAAVQVSLTRRKLGAAIDIPADPPIEEAPAQQLTVRDVVAGLRRRSPTADDT